MSPESPNQGTPITDFDVTELAAIEKDTQDIGRYLFAHVRDTGPGILQRRWWDEQLLNWTMRDEALRVQLFRFVDVLPMLRTPEAVADHLHEYLSGLKNHLPVPLRMALGFSRWASLTRAAVAKIVHLATEDLAKRFIAGSNLGEVLAAAKRQRDARRAFTLDILGEAVISEREADRFCRAYADLIEAVAPVANEWPECPQIDQDDRGPLPRTNVSIKLSALDSQFDAIDPEGTRDRVSGRLRELLRIARRAKAFIHVDMESYDKKDLTLHIFRSVLLEPEFRDVTDVGIVIQCYLRDADADLVSLRDWARQRGAPVWVRLVKGAYWDYETVKAAAHGWPVPVYLKKPESDAAFERATRFVMRHRTLLRPAFGTHNVRSLAHAIAVARHLDVPQNGLEIQMLFGMGDAEKDAFVELGHRMRIYMPYGELIPGMAYLVRRLLENTSNESFLRAGFVEHRPVNVLLANPNDLLVEASSATAAS